jgi:Flp pilus assembly protein TadG
MEAQMRFYAVQTVNEFGADRSGSFAILTAMMAAVLALSAGFALNLAQLYNARSALRSSLDAAVTSTARDITTGVISEGDARAWVERFLKANGDPTIMDGERIVLDTLVVDKASKTLDASAYVDVALYFPLFGVDSERRVSTESAALYSDKQIEVVMMLDVTGSMEKKGKKDKIGDLRTAAANAVNALLDGQDAEKPRVRVALVPYASGVNVGDLAANVYAESESSSNLPPVAGSELLKDKTGKKTLPDFASYKSIVADAFSKPDACATERKKRNGNADLTAAGPQTIRTDKNGDEYYALVNRDDRMTGKGMNACPEAEVIPLTGDSEALLDSIGKFEANGYTAGAIGVQWAYYMLSPEWSPAIVGAGLGDGPAAYNSSKISKVAILMTDGEFNTAFTGGDDVNDQGSKARSAAEGLCGNMKSEGIEIFTIGFDLGTGETQAKTVLKNCATKDVSSVKHYHEASTGADLDNAFKEIIRNIERLVLTN